MESLTLQFNKSIKEKLLKLLSTFSESDLKIYEIEHFDDLKNRVAEDYAEYKSGKSKLLDLDEVEDEMNKIISENEDSSHR